MDKLALIFREAKVKLELELRTEFRADFELKLANKISESSALLQAVHHVSLQYAEQIEANREFVLDLLENSKDADQMCPSGKAA